MLDNRALIIAVLCSILLMPWWITGVSGTSWNNSLKRWLIVFMVIISALSISIVIATPNPHLPTKIIGTLASMVFFLVSIITAYRVWPQETG
jgi:hypothetical protein